MCKTIRKSTRGRIAMVLVAVSGGSIGCDIPRRPEFVRPESGGSNSSATPNTGSVDLATSGSTDLERPLLPLEPAEFRYGIKEGTAMASVPYVGDQTLQIERNKFRVGQPATSTITMKRRVWLRNGNLQLIDRLEIHEQQDGYGEVLHWTVLRQQGPWLKKLRGVVSNGSMSIRSEAGRPERPRAIEWPAGDRGFFVNQSVYTRDQVDEGKVLGPLRALRIQSGDRLVDPVSAMVSSAGTIQVAVDNQLMKLPEVITSFQAENQILAEQTSYVDQAGWPLRSVDQDNFVAMRVSEDRELGLDPEPIRDIEIRTVGLPWPADSNTPVHIRIRSLGELSDEELFKSIPEAERQEVQVNDSAIFVFLNSGIGSNPKSSDSLISPPAEADLQSTNMADHGHPAVRKIANAATRGMASDDLDTMAKSISDTAWNIIEETKRFTGLVPASRVAVNLSSDAFGRAGLAAAMLRSKKIPTRLAVGVAIREGRTTFHAWPIVFLDGQWQPMDHDLKRTDRLTLAITDLDFDSVHDSIEKVLSTLAAIEIEVISKDELPQPQATD